MSGKKILVITSSEDTLQLQSGKKVKTGTFLNEMMVPLLKLREKGYTFTLANPKGLAPALDPLGDRTLWFGFSTDDYLAARNLFDTLKQSVRALSSLEESELQSYTGVFIPGGHAPLVDLSSNHDVGRILAFFHAQKKPIGSICHGPAALLSARSDSGQFLFNGYKVTAYSNREEAMNELMWWDKVPLHVEDKLRESGALISNSWMPAMSNVVVDRELITGQGPTSAGKFAETFANALEHGVAPY